MCSFKSRTLQILRIVCFQQIIDMSVIATVVTSFFVAQVLLAQEQTQGEESHKPQMALASPSVEQDFQSERKAILWSEFRNKVMAVLPNYTQEELTQELAELDVKAQYIGGDIYLNAVASQSLAVDPTNTLDTLDTNTMNLYPQVSKKFLDTGTTITIGLNNTLRTSRIEGQTLRHTSIIIPKLTVTQDLLQNFFGLLDRLNITNAKKKLAIVKAQRNYDERKLQQNYDQLYLNWILLWRMQEVLVEQLHTSTQSLSNAQNQRKLNYIDNGTYQQIYNLHLVYRQTLQNNEQKLLEMDQRFARFLGTTLYKPDLEALDSLLKNSLTKFDELHFEDSWTWAISKKGLDQTQILYKFSKLSRLPSLTLSGSIELETTATYDGSEQPKYSKLKPTYSVNLNLSWPVLRRRANNNIETLHIQLKQLENTLNSQRQNFEIEIAKRRSDHEFLLENYQIQQEAAKAKAAIYASNQVKYRQARANIRDLLDAELQNLSADLNLLITQSQLVQQMLDYSYEVRDGDFLSR